MGIKQRCVALCLAAVFSTGCAVNRYSGPVGNFRDKANRSAAVLAEFYSSRNQYEIDLYLTEVAVDPTQQVLLKNSDGTSTPLGKPTFSPAGIQARLSALDLIGVYANRLADLASSDAPQRFNTAATLLGDNLTSLSSTFGTLSGSGDPTAGKYIGPISKLVGAIGEMILENKRDQLITAGIQNAAPQVDQLLILIRNDLEKIFSLQASAGGNQRFATLASAYNNEDRTKLSYEARKQRLAEIKDAARARADDVSSAPSALVTSMADAHAALVRLAKSKRTPADFSQFNAELELWTTRIETLAAQFRVILD